MTEERIKINITASLTVRYNQTVGMTKKEWESIKAQNESDAGESIKGWLDMRDVFDAGSIENFECAVVDSDGNRVSPVDEYLGGVKAD